MIRDRAIRPMHYECNLAETEAMLLGTFLQDQRRRGCAESTIVKRRYELSAWMRWLEPREIREASREDVQRFLDGRKLGDRARYSWISSLHSFYVWAIDVGEAAEDPTVRIRRPRLRQGLPRPIADEDLTAALAGAVPMMRAWLTLAAFGGLRVGEIAILEREDVLDSYRLLRVVGKGRRERLVPIHDRVTEALRAAGMPRTGRLFTRDDGRPYTAVDVSFIGNSYLREMGIDATMHQLRHWCATTLYRESSDLLVVQGVLGHASISTTTVYTKYSDQAATDAVRGLKLA